MSQKSAASTALHLSLNSFKKGQISGDGGDFMHHVMVSSIQW